MHRSSTRFGRISRFESLETRPLLAGNVTAVLSGTGLSVTGDAAANSIQVSRLADGDWQVKGIATKINGINSPADFAGVTDIGIDLGAGNDTMQLSGGTLPHVLNISDSAGNTTILLNNFHSLSDIDISLTGGNNSIIFNNVSSENQINVYTAGKNDTIVATKTSAASTRLDASGTGNDTVVMSNCSGEGDLEAVTLGRTNQTVITNSNVLVGISSYSFDTAGTNTVTIANCNVGYGSIFVDGSHGTNVIAVQNCVGDRELNISARALARKAMP